MRGKADAELVTGDARRSRLRPESSNFLWQRLYMQKMIFLHQIKEPSIIERMEKGERV
jgi:hypothetical protein